MYNTQLNAWKYNYNAHGMQCMKFLRSNLQNPSQNFTKTSLILKNPKFCKNPKNLGFKEWNAWKWGIRDLSSEEKLDWARKNAWGRGLSERGECLGYEQPQRDRKRLRKWSLDRTRIYV